jgi:DNA-binding MarR family transcriptional regulator
MKNNIKIKPDFWDLLFILKRNISNDIKKEGLRCDLTSSQIEVLHFIGPSGKETMKSIADYLKITPPSTTEIVTEMEKKGLVKRKNNKNDRRIVFIVLTPLADKLFKLLHKRKEFILKKMLSKLDKKDRENLERIIRIIITN